MRRLLTSLGAITLALTLTAPLAAQDLIEYEPIIDPGPIVDPGPIGNQPVVISLPAVQSEQATSVIAIIGVLEPGDQ